MEHKDKKIKDNQNSDYTLFSDIRKKDLSEKFNDDGFWQLLETAIVQIESGYSFLEENQSIEKKLLERSLKILKELLEIYENLDYSRTSYEVFNELVAILKDINKDLEQHQLGKDRINILDNQINSTLKLIPLLVTEKTDEVEITQKKLISYEDKGKKIVSRLKDFESDGEKLILSLTEETISGFYGKKADGQAKLAKWWTIGTWIFAISTLVIIILTFIYAVKYSSSSNVINYQLLSSKILMTATLGFIAKWCSKRANRYLIESAKYRRLSLNMATLKPFTETLDEDKQKEVIAAIAIKTFTDTGVNEGGTDFESVGLGEIFKDFIKPTSK